MVNPCICGCSLQEATKIIAIIDIVSFAIMGVMSVIFGILAIIASIDANGITSEVWVLIASFLITLIICILGIFLGLLLKRGSDTRDLKKCKIWLIITIVLIVIDVLSYFGMIRSTPTPKLTVNGIALLYRLFAAWVVYEFIQELKILPNAIPRAAGVGGTTGINNLQQV